MTHPEPYASSLALRGPLSAKVRAVLAEHALTAEEEIAILAEVIEAIAREAYRLPPEVDQSTILREIMLACRDAA
jgi:hypothetical protein